MWMEAQLLGWLAVMSGCQQAAAWLLAVWMAGWLPGGLQGCWLSAWRSCLAGLTVWAGWGGWLAWAGLARACWLTGLGWRN